MESLVPNVNFASKKYASKTQDEIEEATKTMYLLLMSDRIRYGQKVREISENVVLSNYSFPETREATYRILSDTQRRLDEDRLRRRNFGGTWEKNMGRSHYGD